MGGATDEGPKINGISFFLFSFLIFFRIQHLERERDKGGRKEEFLEREDEQGWGVGVVGSLILCSPCKQMK